MDQKFVKIQIQNFSTLINTLMHYSYVGLRLLGLLFWNRYIYNHHINDYQQNYRVDS